MISLHLQPDNSPIVTTTILGRTIRVCGYATKPHLIQESNSRAMSVMKAWLIWLRHGSVHISGKQNRTYR